MPTKYLAGRLPSGAEYAKGDYLSGDTIFDIHVPADVASIVLGEPFDKAPEKAEYIAPQMETRKLSDGRRYKVYTSELHWSEEDLTIGQFFRRVKDGWLWKPIQVAVDDLFTAFVTSFRQMPRKVVSPSGKKAFATTLSIISAPAAVSELVFYEPYRYLALQPVAGHLAENASLDECLRYYNHPAIGDFSFDLDVPADVAAIILGDPGDKVLPKTKYLPPQTETKTLSDNQAYTIYAFELHWSEEDLPLGQFFRRVKEGWDGANIQVTTDEKFKAFVAAFGQMPRQVVWPAPSGKKAFGATLSIIKANRAATKLAYLASAGEKADQRAQLGRRIYELLQQAHQLDDRPFQLDVTGLPAGGEHPYEKCPQIIGYANPDGTIEIAWQNASGTKIFVHRTPATLNPSTANPLVSRREFPSFGLLAGFTREGDNNYVMTAARHQNREDLVDMKIFQNDSMSVLWEAHHDNNKAKAKAPLNQGSGRLAFGGDKLFATFNLSPAHPYQVMLDSHRLHQTAPARETEWHHNYDQRLLFDGQNFVVMENRDHDVGLTLMKFSPTEPYPFKPFAERLRSIYAHTNYGNETHLELGDIEPGLNGGYLILFASERDWDDKYKGYSYQTGKHPAGMTGPFDLAVVHAVADFDRQEANWRDFKRDSQTFSVLDRGGKPIVIGKHKPERVYKRLGDKLAWGWFTQAPWHVDTSQMVNSLGPSQTVSRHTRNDGWNFVDYWNNDPKAYSKIEPRRHTTTKGVHWLTNHGLPYVGRIPTRSDPHKPVKFLTVTRPKLVKIGEATYIAIWEEHLGQVGGSINGGIRWPTEYQTTKALTISLSPSGDRVAITAGPAQELGAVRLHWHDDAFAWNDRAAWLTGDMVARKLLLHTLDKDLNYTRYNLTL